MMSCSIVGRAAAVLLCMIAPAIAAADAPVAGGGGFSLRDKPGEYLDILLDGRVVGRYMYAYDKSTRKRQAETYKPYLHVFDAQGKAPITKGPGGQDTHHRGIYIGWQQVGFQGEKYNLWEMGGGAIVHQKFAPGGRSPAGDRHLPDPLERPCGQADYRGRADYDFSPRARPLPPDDRLHGHAHRAPRRRAA